ncbi:MAG: hypothetical protein LBK45_03750 [Tannerellaceae bacterium]|nr:hypothetical protein [Tannerellaceae bacterium]
MKRKRFAPCILLVVCILCLSGCEKDASDSILGKWELKERAYPEGKLQPVEPSGYTEYLPNGIVRTYDYELKTFTPADKMYWIVRDSLFVNMLNPGEDDVNQGAVFRYRFVNGKKMVLEVERYLGKWGTYEMKPVIFVYKKK